MPSLLSLLSSKFLRLFLLCLLLLVIPSAFFILTPTTSSVHDSLADTSYSSGSVDLASHTHSSLSDNSLVGDSEVLLGGGVVMPHLGNETAKAELGRATWKLLHLMTLRFPESPTPDERQALKSYFYLFSRLYPCGECAAHFQAMLKEYPPQTSSRKSSSLWLCHLHNLVNTRLLKPPFDCLTLDATYDCGCAEDPTTTTTNGRAASAGTGGVGAGKNGAAGKGGEKGKVEIGGGGGGGGGKGRDDLTGVEMMKGGR
ncbi:ERV/ALR sulfhydryl oxidase domain-containing protein [Mrakia frigida]|uniref:ERV/ALR sulfhydryl oxidase domain-containing protein n=1 Tax=Mrakia frigida TaxID=29902 RepID=UPI003FCBF80A